MSTPEIFAALQPSDALEKVTSPPENQIPALWGLLSFMKEETAKLEEDCIIVLEDLLNVDTSADASNSNSEHDCYETAKLIASQCTVDLSPHTQDPFDELALQSPRMAWPDYDLGLESDLHLSNIPRASSSSSSAHAATVPENSDDAPWRPSQAGGAIREPTRRWHGPAPPPPPRRFFKFRWYALVRAAYAAARAERLRSAGAGEVGAGGAGPLAGCE